MISVRDLRKVYRTRFGEKLVLDGVGFDLRSGERLGVLGRNGAGKSTMIRLVSGAERPSAGTVERGMSVSWPLAFGGAFQPWLTGVDNIRFISRIYAQDFESNLAFVEDFAELGPYLREPVRTYSSGMRARLAFAISMIIEFDCFLIDEIGAVGDARFHDRCNHELFEKRGDRAMIIISHDAGYLRDQCNRWSVLHEGRLALHDGFEDAYTSYKEVAGALLGHAKPVVSHRNRSAMIESSQRAALADERFRLLVQDGDWARDSRDWALAEQKYEAALALYPYQRTYWTQLGHVTKEQDKAAEAEIAYRTAASLGVPRGDVADFIRFVAARQHGDPAAYPIPAYRPGGAAEQAPARPDIEAFAWLFWPARAIAAGDILDLLRCHPTCDGLLAAMIGDDRFAGGRPPSASGRSGGLAPDSGETAEPLAAAEPFAGREMFQRICCLFAPGLDPEQQAQFRDEFETVRDVAEWVAACAEFADWPLSAHALAGALASGREAPVSPSRPALQTARG